MLYATKTIPRPPETNSIPDAMDAPLELEGTGANLAGTKATIKKMMPPMSDRTQRGPTLVVTVNAGQTV
jgi:hypothetical protein